MSLGRLGSSRWVGGWVGVYLRFPGRYPGMSVNVLNQTGTERKMQVDGDRNKGPMGNFCDWLSPYSISTMVFLFPF